MTVARRASPEESGQVIILMVLALTIVFAVGAITVDVGIWLSERRGVARAADFASLAGTLSLPADPDQAEADAFEYAARNGYVDGVDGVQITVELYCSNNIVSPPPGICLNTDPSGKPSLCATRVGCDSIRVIIREPGKHLFSAIFGFSDVKIGFGAMAVVDFEINPIDTAMLLDATGSMGDAPCNGSQSNNGCPIKEAKAAATDFTNILLNGQSNLTKIGFAPYRGCYNPPRLDNDCVPAANVIDLTTNKQSILNRISATSAQGGSGTNVCLGLFKALEMFNGPNAQPGSNVQKFVIILTDGDNTYNNASWGQNQPPVDCRPNTSPQNSDSNTGSGCSSAQTRERELDVKTKARADQLAALGAEVFVVGFGVCGTPSNNTPTAAYCGGIGNTSSDNTADRRLLRCIASSAAGTNDHYYEVPTASDLPTIFQAIAWKIAGRALSE